jgi:hypothetical protein
MFLVVVITKGESWGFKTDSRSLMGDMDNPLITGALKGRIAKSFQELKSLLKSSIKESSILPNRQNQYIESILS